jgi:Tfp pilus assembly protein PilX
MTRTRNLHDEGGFVLATAMIIMALMLVVGFVALQTVDVQTHQTSKELGGEAAFNLAESVLDAEAIQIQAAWPGSTPGFSTACNQASAPTTGCPGTSLTSAFSSTYAGPQLSSPVWTVQVLDDSGGANYYSDSIAGTAAHYDANGDNKLWVRATATIGGQQRIVVAQMVRQLQVVTLPHNVITAGSVSTSNNGNKVIIAATDPGTGLSGAVALRCVNTATPDNSNPCAGWDEGKGQLSPTSNYVASYVDPNAGNAALSGATLTSLKAIAVAAGTYYAAGTCPPAGQSGTMYVENADCSYNGWAASATPSTLIFAAGTLSLNGNASFYGVVYMANGQNTTGTSGACTPAVQNGPIVSVHGGSNITGAIFVDRCGTVDAGSAGNDIVFSSVSFSAVQAYAPPTLAKNTFRIVPNP